MFKFGIENFRAFKKETFDFSKVNILIGENSSGKSSILKFFLAMKESLEPQNAQEINFTFSGNAYNMGNFEEAIYYHDIEQEMKFEFEFGEEFYEFMKGNIIHSIHKTEDKDLFLSYCRKENKIKLSITLNKNLNDRTQTTMRIEHPLVGCMDIIKKSNNSKLEKSLFNIKYYDYDTKIEYTDNVETKQMGFTVDSLAFIQNVTQNIGNKSVFLALANVYLVLFCSRVSFVNPMLSMPERTYIKMDKRNTTIVNTIEKLVHYWVDNADDNFRNKLNIVVQELEIAKEVYVKVSGASRELRIKINDLDSSIQDVGLGVALQLAIIAQALLDNEYIFESSIKGKILLIEQPEIHLHPRLQAKLIEVLVKYAPNNTYIIETHSEHIVRKLQVLVKKGNLQPEDVSINYLRREDKQIVKTKHEISSNGALTPKLPKGFYDNTYNLAKELLD